MRHSIAFAHRFTHDFHAPKSLRAPVGARFSAKVRSPVYAIRTHLALEAASKFAGGSHVKFAPGSQPPLRANRRPHADLSRQSRKTSGGRPRVTFIKSYGWRLEVSTEVSTISSGFFWKPAHRTAYFSLGGSDRSPPLGKHPMNERKKPRTPVVDSTQCGGFATPQRRGYFDHALTECETGMRRNQRPAGVRGLFRLGHVKVGRLNVSHPDRPLTDSGQDLDGLTGRILVGSDGALRPSRPGQLGMLTAIAEASRTDVAVTAQATPESLTILDGALTKLLTGLDGFP